SMILRWEAVGMLDILYRADEEIEIDDDARTQLRDNSLEVLERSIAVLRDLEDFTTDTLQTALKQVLVEEMEIKPRFAFGPLRTAISGRRVSPPLFESMEILGKESSLARLEALAEDLRA